MCLLRYLKSFLFVPKKKIIHHGNGQFGSFVWAFAMDFLMLFHRNLLGFSLSSRGLCWIWLWLNKKNLMLAYTTIFPVAPLMDKDRCVAHICIHNKIINLLVILYVCTRLQNRWFLTCRSIFFSFSCADNSNWIEKLLLFFSYSFLMKWDAFMYISLHIKLYAYEMWNALKLEWFVVFRFI